MPRTDRKLSEDIVNAVRTAALDQNPVSGLTHRFYRYPARFSPTFPAACIEALSSPGDIVLDPYMGGATTILEAYVRGRRALGSDINTLSAFVARAKTTQLSDQDRSALVAWATSIVPTLNCRLPVIGDDFNRRPRNMHLPTARWLRKTIALCLESAQANVGSDSAFLFARCILLNVGQWALNGRRIAPSAKEFRERVAQTTHEMLGGEAALAGAIESSDVPIHVPILRVNDAEKIDQDEQLIQAGPVDLVVTSPPYPGVHMLYHRWQVDGRKETDTPYWIAECNDGCGTAYYNFADRRGNSEDRYFTKAENTFSAVRRLMRDGAMLVQMVAFSEPERQLPRYLQSMQKSGFSEFRHDERIWRSVPGRRWHANNKGNLACAREVVLMHCAD